jgi:hypothetical protein
MMLFEGRITIQAFSIVRIFFILSQFFVQLLKHPTELPHIYGIMDSAPQSGSSN